MRNIISEFENRKLNNKGFTMIELIVATAIFSILSITIFTFMSTGAMQYNRINNFAKLQIDSQVAMAQIEEYIIDCKEEIKYDSTENKLYIDKLGLSFKYEASQKTLYLIQSGIYNEVVKNVDEFKIEFPKSFDEIDSTDDTKIETLTKARNIKISLRLSKNNRDYTATKILALRNNPEIVTP